MRPTAERSNQTRRQRLHLPRFGAVSAAIVLTLIVLVAGAIFGFINARRLENNRRLVNHTYEVVGSLETLLSTLKDAETGQRGFLLTEDEQYLEPYRDALTRESAELDRLKTLTSDNALQQARLATLREKIDQRFDELKQTVDLFSSGDRVAALAIVRNDLGKTTMDELRRDVAAMQRTELDLLKTREDQAANSYIATVASIVRPAVIGVVLIGLVGYLGQRNLRHQQKAALMLGEEKERLRTTLASIGDAVISTDPDARVIYLNPVAESLTGWTNADAVGLPLTQIFHIVNESTRLPVDNPALRALEHGLIVGLANHTVLIARNGSERPIDDSAAPIRSVDGEVVGCVLVFRDITSRHHAEAQLRDREEQFRRTLNEVAIPTLLHADDDQILLVNKAWTSLSGYRHQDIPTISDWTQRAYGERHIFVKEYIDALFDSDVRVDNGEWDVTTATGETRIWHFFTTPVGREHGGRRLLVSNAIDVTDQRRAEGELRRLAAELSDADRRKDEFLATLAHELRNPLAPIRNGLEILQRGDPGGAVHEQVRVMMKRQTDQLVRLVDDLMDVSRITRGTLELRKEQVELAVVLRHAVETARPEMEAKGQQLTMTLPPTPAVVDADATRLCQVFANLLNNAAKFSDRGGHIWLTVERQDGEFVIGVKDAGIGIAPAALPKIFDMFVQADSTLERSQGGLGIGLTLAKRLVEMHAGRIEARSAGLGTGSEFVVRLPAALSVPRSAGRGTDASGANAAVPSRRILIADDNDDSVTTLEMLLTALGNDVRTARDGQEAVDVARQFEPEMVVMDIGMPKLNGYDACRQIRALPFAARTVMVALSGWGQENDKRRSQEAGFHFHLVKPVDPVTLEQVLAQMGAPGDA